MKLEKRSEVSFRFTDISGKQLRNVNNPGLPAGHHKFEINLSDREKQCDLLLLIIHYEGRMISRKIILR